MVTGDCTTSMSKALECGDQGNEHGGDVPPEIPSPQDDQAANDPAVPVPDGDVDETASVSELVSEVEEPYRPVTPPGHEQDLDALKESVNQIVGAMDTLLRRIPVHQETPVQPVGHGVEGRDTRETSPIPGAPQDPRIYRQWSHVPRGACADPPDPEGDMDFPLFQNWLPSQQPNLAGHGRVRPVMEPSRPVMEPSRLGPNGGQRKPRLPCVFTGKDEMWEDYIKCFKGVVLWNRWGNDDKAEGLYLALDGSAANYVYSHPLCEAVSFDELCTMLETRYGATRSAAIDRKRLKECRREKGETYADLGQDILRIDR